MYRVVQLIVGIASAGLVACAATPTAGPADAARPSIAATESLEFLGKRFERKFEHEAGPVRRYEYFAGGDTPERWLELVEFQVYPVQPEGNAPVDFARRTAAALQQRFPRMRFGLYTDEQGNTALLDFIYPRSLRREPGRQFIEFNAFKFFRDQGSRRTLSFHYARNIEGLSRARSEADVIEDLKDLREQVLPALAELPLYRQ